MFRFSLCVFFAKHRGLRGDAHKREAYFYSLEELQMNQKKSIGMMAAVVAGMLASAAWAQTVHTLQPDEVDSEDVFTYEFDLVTGGFGIPGSPADTNLDTDTVISFPSPVGDLLGTSKTNRDPHPDGSGGTVDAGHSAHTWIRFDVNSTGLTGAQVASAKLNLFAIDGLAATGAFDNPTVTNPVTVDVYEAPGSWGEQTLTFNSEPGTGTNLIASVTQTGVDQWLTWDVTSLVKAWLDGTAAQDGFLLQQRDVVFAAQGTGGLIGYVASLYASSAAGPGGAILGDASQRPFLEITEVPEPSAAAVLLAAGAFMLIRRR